MSYSAVKTVNSRADVSAKGQAVKIQVNCARGLMEALKTNLGPKGTIKMLVGGAGDIKLTKDGAVLLHEMQLQNPTANLIARTATAQDDITGDGTTSAVLLIGELMRQADRWLQETLHPRVLVEGFNLAKKQALTLLEEMKIEKDIDRDVLVSVAQTSLRTKLRPELADLMTDIVVDGILTIRRDNQPIDLFMVEIMSMQHKTAADTRLVRGLVLDHGSRQPNMKKYHEDCYILTCNVSLEYEKTEVNSAFYYSTAEERERMVAAERKQTDDKVKKIIEFKHEMCGDTEKGFIVINMKGIDQISLDMLQKAGIVGIRRAKRRNLERLTLACGGYAVNSVQDLSEDCLGHAGKVYEHVLGEDKFTFVEDVQNPYSCTALIKGPNAHTVAQMKDALRDGLRAVKNTIEDGCVLPGGGAIEVALSQSLHAYSMSVEGRARLGVQAFADALLVIPKTLAANAGFDPTDAVVKLQDAHAAGRVEGFDLDTGATMDPEVTGVWDNFIVKRQLLHSSTVIASNLLLCDQMIRAGKNIKSKGPGGIEH